jgi:hypothetical protein
MARTPPIPCAFMLGFADNSRTNAVMCCGREVMLVGTTAIAVKTVLFIANPAKSG